MIRGNDIFLLFLRLLRLGDSSRCYVWVTTPAMMDDFSCGAIYVDGGGGGFLTTSQSQTFQSNLRLIVMKHRLHLSYIIYLPSFLRHQGVPPGRGMGRGPKRSRGQQRKRRDRGERAAEGRIMEGWIVRVNCRERS